MTRDAPPPVADLDWSPERASAFGARVLELYSSLLAELPEAPTSPPLTTASVRAAVAVEVPEEPLDDDALIAHLQAILDHSVPSNADVHGRAAIRSRIVSYRTEARHLEQLLDLTREIGERVHGSGLVA